MTAKTYPKNYPRVAARACRAAGLTQEALEGGWLAKAVRCLRGHARKPVPCRICRTVSHPDPACETCGGTGRSWPAGRLEARELVAQLDGVTDGKAAKSTRLQPEPEGGEKS